MKKQVESEKVTTVQKTVTICDKCGLEATDSRELYSDVRTAVHDNTFGEEPIVYAARHAPSAPTHHRHLAHELQVRPGHVVIEEFRDWEPDVELCADCYDEILGWRDD